jgi:hypothetical protein
LKSTFEKKAAKSLLDDLWNYRIRPSWWRWWLASPSRRKRKRTSFTILVGLLIFFVLNGLFRVWNGSEIFSLVSIGLILTTLIWPNIERFKKREIEFEITPPPSFIPVLSPSEMEEISSGTTET